MRWNTESPVAKFTRLSKPHRWFAWYPVFCYQDGKTAWLEVVERRLTGAPSSTRFEYKLTGGKRP